MGNTMTNNIVNSVKIARKKYMEEDLLYGLKSLKRQTSHNIWILFGCQFSLLERVSEVLTRCLEVSQEEVMISDGKPRGLLRQHSETRP